MTDPSERSRNGLAGTNPGEAGTTTATLIVKPSRTCGDRSLRSKSSRSGMKMS